MKTLFKSLSEKSTARYVFIGGVGFLVELLVIFVMQEIGASGTAAVAVSFVVGLGVSFILQKIITFRDKQFHKKILARQAYLYALLVLFNFGFTVLAVSLLEQYFPVALIRAVALAITVVWNYYVYNTWIFKRDAR